MSHSLSDLAKEFELKPGVVYGVLNELGIDHDGTSFEADSEVLELIRESLLDRVGSKEIVLKRGQVTPRTISHALDAPQAEVQKTLLTKLKVMAHLTTTLKDEVAEQLVEQFGYTIRWADAVAAKPKPKPGPASGDQSRPPVVTIMGHVDHGKTSLLDYIRKTKVAEREFGGITQHIGAYQVQLDQGKITFLDTPGHAAFTAMRARGAQVTDIAILVVAADDGIMPTTREAIQHIQAANVPMIVAINKIDKPDANPDRVLQQLTEFNVIPEAYGGQTMTFNVSALTGEGVQELLEGILLLAEVLELKADPKGELRATVIEAKVEKGRGTVATLLVQSGTLKLGDSLVVGSSYGKIKAMTDYLGKPIEEAGPSTPVEVLGLDTVPAAGERVERAKDEKAAREIAEARKAAEREASLNPQRSRGMSLRDLRERLNAEEVKELRLVVRADVQGSVEAVKGMLEKVRNEEVETKIMFSGVGNITESDVLLASTADAIVVGFNVKPEGKAKQEAERRKVEIRTYNIIYELIEDIEAAVKGMLEPKFEENYLGTAEIRLKMQFGRKGTIAGCYVTDGKITRNCQVRIKRGRDVIHEGRVASLKHFKDDVREVTVGMECGMTFENWEAFEEGDVIEAFEMVQVNL
jgi:translation initiation factor IF-2